MRNLLSQRPRTLVVAVAALLILGIAGSWGYGAVTTYEAAVARAERDVSNARKSLVEHTARTFEAISRALEAAVDLRREVEAGLVPEAGVYDLLKAIHGGTPVLQGIGWSDAAGNRLISSRTRYAPPLNMKGQDHFDVHAGSPDVGLHIGKPLVSRVDGTEIVVASRRANDREGRFAGVVNSAIELDYFRSFYRSLDLGADGSLLLLRDDGAVLIREPRAVDGAPASMADTALFRERLPKESSATYRIASRFDGQDRFVSFGRVAGFPLVVGTTVSARDALAPYYRWLGGSIIRMGFTLAAIAAAAAILLRLLRRNDEALRTKSLLASIVESSEDAVITMSLDGTITSWNAAATRMFGHGGDEAVGQPIDLIVPSECRDEEAGIIEIVRAGEVLTNCETARRRKDGALVDVSITASPLKDEAGAIIGVSMIARDITERKRADAKFRSVLELAPDAMVIANDQGRIVLVNAQTERLFGYHRDELLGQPVEILMPDRARARHPEHRRQFAGEPRVREMGSGMELHGLRKDGTEFPIEISLSPMQAPEGLLVFGAIRDTSERKQRERELEAQRAMLAEKSALLESVFASMRQGIVVLDKELRVVAWNDQLSRFFDASRVTLRHGQLLEDRLRILAGSGEYGDEDPESAVQSRLAIARSRQHRHYERACPNGTHIEVEWVPMANGYMAVTHLDITERKQREAESEAQRAMLVEKSAQLEAVFASTKQGIVVFDPDLRIAAWNDQMSRFYTDAAVPLRHGMSLEERLRLLAARDVYGGGDPEEEVQSRLAIARGRQYHHYERQYPNGMWIEVEWMPMANGYLAVTHLDITERKRREIENEAQARLLAEKSLLLESVFKTMGQGVAVYDREFRLVAWNEHLRTMDDGGGVNLYVGAPLEDRLRHFAERGALGEGDPEAIVADRMAKARAREPGRYVRHGANGMILDVQWAPMPNGFHVITHTDVTEQKRAEAALKASEERFRDFALSSADWYWEQDENLRFTYVSAATTQFSARRPEDNYGKTRRETAKLGVSEDEWKRHDAVLAARLPLRDFRYQRIDSDGRLHHLSVSGVPVFDDTGEFRGYRGTGRDITREVESAAMLRAVVDAIPAMINAKDKESRYILMNSYQASVYGTTPAEAVGKTAADLLGERYGGYTAGLDRRVIESGQASDSYEESYAGVDGVERQWLTAKRPLRDARGAVEYVITVAMDVSRLKEAEAKLRAVEAELRASEASAAKAHARLSDAIGSMSDGFILWDERDRLVLRNDAAADGDADMAARLVPGATFREVMEQRVRAGFVPAAKGHEDAYVQARLDLHRNPPPQPYVHQLSDGRWMSLRERRTQEGGVVAIRSDITQLKQREAELAAAREAAEEANRAKSDFLSRMSHELRTPLNAVIGFAQMLELDRSQTLTDRQKEYCGHIEQGGRHLLSLVNDILDLSRVESGNLKMSIERVVVAEALEGLRDTLVPLAEKAGVALELADASKVPDVRADDLRLRQVLINLASNAIKYNRPGGSVFLSAMGTPGGRVRFIVMDTGIGIKPEQQAQMFTPFHRGGAEYTAIEGTGIGLAIAKRLVEAMNGTIGFSSVPDQGSTFWVELPIETAKAAPVAGADDPAKALPPSRATAGGYSLLYVEDNPVNLRLMEHLISTLPNVVMLSAATPRLGIDLAIAHRPNVIVLDLNIPEMSGLEVLARLKALPETRDIPVLALTAAAMPVDISRGLAAGFFRYLAKPLDVKAFLSAVDEALGAGGAAGTVELESA